MLIANLLSVQIIIMTILSVKWIQKIKLHQFRIAHNKSP